MPIINPESDKDALTGATTNVAKTTGLAAVLTGLGAPVVSIFTGIQEQNSAIRITLIGATAIVLAAAAIAWAIVAAADLRARAAGEAAKATATAAKATSTAATAATAAQGTVVSSLLDAGAGVEGCLEVLKSIPNAAALSTDVESVRSHLVTAQERSGGDSSVVTSCIEMASYLIASLPSDLRREQDRQALKEGLMGLQLNIVRAAVFAVRA
jgi:hypothetical protein